MHPFWLQHVRTCRSRQPLADTGGGGPAWPRAGIPVPFRRARLPGAGSNTDAGANRPGVLLATSIALHCLAIANPSLASG